jgi:hypothetical protein
LNEPHTVPSLDPLVLHDGEQVLMRSRASVNEKFLRGLAYGWLYLTTDRLAWHRGTDLVGSMSAASPYGLEWALADVSIEKVQRKLWSDLLVTCSCHDKTYRVHTRKSDLLPPVGARVEGSLWLASVTGAMIERG